MGMPIPAVDREMPMVAEGPPTGLCPSHQDTGLCRHGYFKSLKSPTAILVPMPATFSAMWFLGRI